MCAGIETLEQTGLGKSNDSAVPRLLLVCLRAGRRMFVIKKGYIGVGLVELKPNDNIYISAGGTPPYALRSVDKPCSTGFAADEMLHNDEADYSHDYSNDRARCGWPLQNTFELVGQCFVHGIMDAQAVAKHAPGYLPFEDRLRKMRYGGSAPDHDLPLRTFHESHIVLMLSHAQHA